MKCPSCGQWNRASQPICIRCGCSLTQLQEEEPSWKNTLRDGQKSAQYYRMDEFGETDAKPDQRDEMAVEMQELKLRKEDGTRQQRRLRAQS
ncbi:MAG: hypothetical protein IJ083_06775, partial [Clostridia bacterium]|nr:hypothetical protein [Clostridia bacterium]